MSIPGHTAFGIAARLYRDLFPKISNVIDGSNPKMIRICEALDEAYAACCGDAPNPSQPDKERG